MSLDGDFARLERLVNAVGRVADGSLLRDVKAAVAPVLSAQIAKGFDESKKPRGGRWRRLKKPRRPGSPNKGGPLYDSGNLRELASHVQVTAEGWLVSIPRPYAARHQYGDPTGGGQGRDSGGRFTAGGGIPARQYLPLEAQGLPRVWRLAVEETATSEWRAAFKSV
jgi:phage gpG-like protein